jgi:single-strand DNA-binding protein
MNNTHIAFAGWVGSEVTLSDVGNGGQVATFRVGSTPRRYRQGEWEDGPTCWYTVKAWRQLGVHVHESVHLGDPVVVQGRLVADVWERDDGTTSTRYVIVATSVGHDLNRGSAQFTRAPQPPTGNGVDESRVREIIHAYDEAGPTLDSNGDVVEPATADPGVDAGVDPGVEPAA